MFCRNCGKELVGTSKICANCGSDPVRARAFCRFCGNATNAQMIWCPKCGEALRVIGESGEALFKKQSLFMVILKVVVVVAIISTYAFFTLSPGASKTVKSRTIDLVTASTGYTALPLHSVVVVAGASTRDAFVAAVGYADPLNSLAAHANDAEIIFLAPGGTKQLTVFALYKNTATSNVTTVGRNEDVTAKSTCRSGNEKIATVTAGGLIEAVAAGLTDITISYTAIPGSANLSATAEGKVPVTVTAVVPVSVR